jgi:hypothetical protein
VVCGCTFLWSNERQANKPTKSFEHVLCCVHICRITDPQPHTQTNRYPCTIFACDYFLKENLFIPQYRTTHHLPGISANEKKEKKIKKAKNEPKHRNATQRNAKKPNPNALSDCRCSRLPFVSNNFSLWRDLEYPPTHPRTSC